AVAMWHSGGRQVVGDLPEGFVGIAGGSLLGLPIGAFYVLAVSVAMWLVTEFTPLGRALYVIGANPKAAQLNGIAVRKHVMGAFVASGALSGFAGVLLASRLQIGQASVGLEFLLPALVGAFLGSTTIRPGRVNVWGTLVGVAILAIGISGIQQFGGAFYVEPLFNGLTLLVSIGIAGWAQQRRNVSIKRRIAARQLGAGAIERTPAEIAAATSATPSPEAANQAAAH
ncbi:MAG: ABC transporter permease, partial [Burkholderiales bacterium]